MPSLRSVHEVEQALRRARVWHHEGRSGRIAELAAASDLIQSLGEHGVLALAVAHPQAHCWTDLLDCHGA